MSSIVTRNLCAGYGPTMVLHDVSAEFRPNEVVALIGANGSGKSTFLKAICGLLRDRKGTVEVGGRNLDTMSAAEIAKQIAFVPQSEAVSFPFTALQVALMGRTMSTPGFLDRAEDVDFAMECLTMVDIAHLADRPVIALSGGELQRVWIARALAQETDIILLDEPTSHLDIRHALDFAELTSKIKANDKTIVAAIHDLNLAAQISDKIFVFKEGRSLGEGIPSKIFDSGLIAEAFGVDFARVELGQKSYYLPR